ncbi:PI-PLC X domain-containing protein 1 [Nothobranchius furzeri]|uniref:PI-PLC X domain-containing protein 1-like n=1 Tax=Nothobranchius furzeri TaxID=105023 RepID=A0A9D2XM38_NOTFU|nr:PI-PLC X domain-containing protein 1 [Nothobranchius furzeri]KAF7204884.1 PI-PLC X domain-containing protein 1-like [Nothobranchius furzeri]
MSHTDWMSQLPPALHSIPLSNLAIPGSHDSMSYDLDINSSIIKPEVLRRFSRICFVRRIVRRWAMTQEVTITEQLNAGVRYFDLRIARKHNDSNPTRLYFHHGLLTRTDVETVLREIDAWASRHPKEVIIVSLSHFEGFDKKIEAQLHIHLIQFIKDLFGAKLMHKMDTPTLNACWGQGKNVIVSYDHPAYHQPALWRKIPYYYGKSMDRSNIIAKLQDVLEKQKPSSYFFVCGINLTLPYDISILKYILRLCDNFPSLIRRGLPKLLRWIKDLHSKTPMNIVASDVVTRANFVSTVVNLNFKALKAN